MKNLHTIHPRLPYWDIPLLTEETFLEICDELADEEDEDHYDLAYGTVLNMWLEDGTPRGLWQSTGTNRQFIVDFSNNYNFGETRELVLRWFREDRNMALDMQEGWVFNIGHENTFHHNYQHPTHPVITEFIERTA